MRRFGLLFVIETLNLGGSEFFLLNLIERLDQSRFRPVVCCLVEKGKMAAQLESRGYKVVSLGWRLGSFTSTVRVLVRLARLLREENIYLAQTFFHRAEILTAFASLFARRTLVVGSQYDVIVPEGRLSRFFLKAARMRVKHVLANCRACKEHRQRLTGQAAGTISVIYNGLTESEYIREGMEEPPLPQGFFEQGRVVAFVGRMYRLKGPDVFLRAAKSISNKRPGTRFLMVGTGPLETELVSTAHDLGIANAVFFVREVPSVREILSKSSVLVSSSRSEGFPGTLLEAMEAGVPVVASRVGGVEELIENGKDGFLFESEDIEGLAEIVSRLLSDDGLAGEVSRRARDKVRRSFRFEDTVSQIESLYARLLAGSAADASRLRVALAVGRGRMAGTERHVFELARAFDRNEVDVTVLVFSEGNLVERLKAEGLRVEVLEKRTRFDFSLLMRLMGRVRRGRFDVLHAQPERLACLAAKLAGVPAVIMTYHVLGPQASDLIEPALTSRTFEKLRALTVDFTIAVSKTDEKVLVEKFGRDPRKVKFIPNGISLSPVPARDKDGVCRELGLNPAANLLCAAARLSPQKGLEFLIRAMSVVSAAFPEAALLIAGEGELEAALKKLASQLDLTGRVIFTGYRDDVLRLIGASDAFILPSLREGMPYVLLEAMLVSRPIIATSVSSEVVLDGRTGLIVPPSDSKALAEAVIKLLRDPALASRLGTSGRDRLEACFSSEKMARDTLGVYNEVLSRKRHIFRK